MIISNDKEAVVYNGEYKPVNVFSGRKKIAGWKEEEYTGKHIEVEDTYNDVLDVAVQGHHEQDSRNAVWWNQMIEEDLLKWTTTGGTKIIEGNEIIYTASTDRTNMTSNYIGYMNQLSFIEGHKYYSTTELWCSKRNSIYFGGSGNLTGNKTIEANVWTEFYEIFTSKITAGTGVNRYYSLGVGGIAGDIIKVRNNFLIDLTAMFGEGKEPTAEQFRRMYPCDYYPYCAGEWRYAEDGADTAFVTPMPELPEEIRCVDNPKIGVGSKGVMWNQTIKNGDFSEGIGTWAGYGNNQNITPIVIDGKLKVTIKNVVDNSFSMGLIVPNNSFKHNDKVFYRYVFDMPRRCRFNFFYMYARKENIWVKEGHSTVCGIYTCEGDIRGKMYCGTNYADTDGFNVGDSYIISSINYYNLTEMFGAGNEPTEEEFCKMFPKDYYPYDAGTLRTIKGLREIVSQQAELPFTLYGANGINDEVEPCVKVNGEWKCRVTRRWWKCKISEFNSISAQTSTPIGYQRFKLTNNIPYRITNAVSITDRRNTVISDIYVYGNGPIMQNANNYVMSGYSIGNSIYLNDFDCLSVNELRQKRKDNYICYVLETPIIELYDPISVRTLPINSIIDCDAEMEANVKVADLVRNRTLSALRTLQLLNDDDLADDVANMVVLNLLDSNSDITDYALELAAMNLTDSDDEFADEINKIING